MSNSSDEMMIPPKTKRGRHNESENEENKDRLSDLPDCVLLHILSFFKAKYAVRTCILSTRWKHLWKRLPTLLLHSSDFSTSKGFSKFVSRVLSLRDGSTALHALDFDRDGCMEPRLLKRIVKYGISHNVQRLGISVQCDIQHIPPCFFSCQTLTSLKLSVFNRDNAYTLFPKSLNLPALTSLHLGYFAFCAGDNGRAEPFSTFNRLSSLIIDIWTVRGAQILCISSTTLVNFTMHNRSFNFSKIELSAPSLCTFAFIGTPHQKLCGSSLSSLKQVNIDAETFPIFTEPPFVLLSWLRELAHIRSLTVSTSTLQALSLVPDLLKVKLLSLCNLTSLKVKLKPLPCGEAAKLGESSPIPDGIVDFLLQNSPSAEVDIIDWSR